MFGWWRDYIRPRKRGKTMHDDYVELGEQIAEHHKHKTAKVWKKVEVTEEELNEMWENGELGTDERFVEVVKYVNRNERGVKTQTTTTSTHQTQARNSQVGGGHYTKLKIQPLEYSYQNNLGAAEHTVIKYVTRWRDKGGVEDLRKARHTLDLLIEMVENENGNE